MLGQLTSQLLIFILPVLLLSGCATGENKNIVLIMGGADKDLDMSPLVDELNKYTSQ